MDWVLVFCGVVDLLVLGSLFCGLVSGAKG